MMHAALASLMPVAHAVVDTQQQLQGYVTYTGWHWRQKCARWWQPNVNAQ
jgi:hypothetical protein